MKRIWAATGLLVLLLLLSTCNIWYLNRLVSGVTQQLEQAQAHLANDNWEEALSLTQSAHGQFTGSAFFLHTALRHSDIDQVETSFQEVLAFLAGQERQPAEYAAANARLINQLELLVEAELPTLQNLL